MPVYCNFCLSTGLTFSIQFTDIELVVLRITGETWSSGSGPSEVKNVTFDSINLFNQPESWRPIGWIFAAVGEKYGSITVQEKVTPGLIIVVTTVILDLFSFSQQFKIQA